MGPGRQWGTWEELILGGAVLRHGTRDWNVVASELRIRTVFPCTFTPQACKTKYEDLQKRYSGSKMWFDELRKRRVAELKRELARSEDSIGSLESKIKSLEYMKQQTRQTDFSSHTESPLARLDSDGTDSFNKVALKEEHSAGSFTEDKRTRESWLCERLYTEVDTKPEPTTISSEQDKDSEKFPEAGYEQVVTIRKRRGQRKRRDCSQVIAEGSESENLGSSNVASTIKDRLTDVCGLGNRDSSIVNRNWSSSNIERDNLMEIFECIAQTETAGVFRHRMDSQKRARYRKVIRQHMDIGTIRSRITGHFIKSTKELFRDLLLLANNALVFYSRRTREYKTALSLRGMVMKEYKQHCPGVCYEATSAFIPCNPPVRPRSARPRPRPLPPPCKDNLMENLNNTECSGPFEAEIVKKRSDMDTCVALHSLLKAKKGLKWIEKVSPPEVGDKQCKASPVKQRKKVRK